MSWSNGPLAAEPAPNASSLRADGTSLTDSQRSAPAEPDADPRVSEAAPRIVLPKAISTPVEYPSTASGEARVLLEITVDAEGRASNPQMIDGGEPFVAAVLASIPTWRFSPATRDGTPTASRIRFVVRFTPPEAAPNADQPPATAPKSESLRQSGRKGKRDSAPVVPEARDPKHAALEVTVTGVRPEAAVVSMGRADVEQMPGAFGDPFRAIDALPGVVPIVSGLPFFFIRGAPPGNQGYFFDGIRVPLLYHMAAGPGVIHPALVDRVDLYAGGYPARYGRFAGAIVSGESRDPPPEYHVQGSVRLVDSGGYVTAPLGRGVVAFGGRYSYTAAIVSLIAPNVKIDYWDYQAKVVQYLSDRDTVSLFGFGSLDLVQDKSSKSAEAYVGTEFHRLELRYQRIVDQKTRIHTAIGIGLDKTLAADAIMVRDRLATVRGDIEHSFSKQAALRVGADVTLDNYDVIIPVPDGSNVRLRQAMPARRDNAAGIWADLPFEASRWVTVVPGIRLDQYWSGNDHATAIEPRISATYSVRKYLRIVHAAGLAHQPPSFIVPIPGFQPAGLGNGLQRSLQSSAGVELDLPKDITAGITLFQNAFFNITDQLSVINRPNADNDEIDPYLRTRGKTFGAELLLRRSFSQRIGGLIAYTLSKSWRTTDGVRVPAAFDRRHVLQVALAFNLGRNWRSSFRGVYYSGVPAASSSGYEESVDYAGNVIASRRRNPDSLPRAPGYWRLDLRLQKRWPVGTKGAYWALTFEALNATLNREVVGYSCSASSCNGEAVGPITIPSIGVEAAY